MAARLEYNPLNPAYRALKKLTTEQLSANDKSEIWATLKAANVKINGQAMGKVKARILKERGDHPSAKPSNGSSGGMSLEKSIPLVMRIAKRVGSLDRLEETISIIRKVQGL